MSVDHQNAQKTEFLTVLTPASGAATTPFLGKLFTKTVDGGLEDKVPPLKWFDARTITVTSITDLHSELVTLATGPTSAALIAGTLTEPSQDRRIRRLKGKTIVDQPSRVLTEDRDKFPNPQGLDPRVDGMAAARWMDSFLPPSLRVATASHAWSSSCCVRSGSQVPATLSAAVRRIGNRPMDEAERVLILKGLDRWVRAAMDAAGIDISKGGIDHRTGFAVQLQYISPPRLPGDMADPLGDRRWLLLDGEADVFDVDAVLTELAPFITKGEQPREARKPRAKRPASEPFVVPTLPDDVAAKLRKPEGAMVLPLDVAAVLARRTSILGNRAAFHLHREKCALMQGYARITLDLIEWVRARVAWGKDHAELRAWHVAGGVPEGQRNSFMLALHSCLAYALDGQGTRDRSFRETVTAVAELCVSREWLDKEWWGSGAHRSVTERIHRHGAGETVDWQGAARSPMYSYRPATIRSLLGISTVECKALGLGGLGDRAARLQAKRKQSGKKTRADLAAETAEVISRAQAMRAKGASIRATAEAVSRSEAWVKKHTIGLTIHHTESRRKPQNSLATPCAPLKERVVQRGVVLSNSEVGTGNQIPDSSVEVITSAREPRRPGRQQAPDRLLDPTIPIPLGPLPPPSWANEGRTGKRRKLDAWISGAGVVLRWKLSDVPGGSATFRDAADAVLEPYRAALRAFEAAQAAEARMTAQDRSYVAWARSVGRMGDVAVMVPPEPTPETIPGTQEWWATNWEKLIRILRGRDWRRGLEEFRRAEPLAFSVLVMHVPSMEQEAKAVKAGGDHEIRIWAKEQSKRENKKHSYHRFHRGFMGVATG